MSDNTQAGTATPSRKTGLRRLLLLALAAAGSMILLMWSFVLPILGIVYLVEKFG